MNVDALTEKEIGALLRLAITNRARDRHKREHTVYYAILDANAMAELENAEQRLTQPWCSPTRMPRRD